MRAPSAGSPFGTNRYPKKAFAANRLDQAKCWPTIRRTALNRMSLLDILRSSKWHRLSRCAQHMPVCRTRNYLTEDEPCIGTDHCCTDASESLPASRLRHQMLMLSLDYQTRNHVHGRRMFELSSRYAAARGRLMLDCRRDKNGQCTFAQKTAAAFHLYGLAKCPRAADQVSRQVEFA
jgi:hypothetical protein